MLLDVLLSVVYNCYNCQFSFTKCRTKHWKSYKNSWKKRNLNCEHNSGYERLLLEPFDKNTFIAFFHFEIPQFLDWCTHKYLSCSPDSQAITLSWILTPSYAICTPTWCVSNTLNLSNFEAVWKKKSSNFICIFLCFPMPSQPHHLFSLRIIESLNHYGWKRSLIES